MSEIPMYPDNCEHGETPERCWQCLSAEVATLRALRCSGSSGCSAHLVLNVEDNARGCEHGTLVGYCHQCEREIPLTETHVPRPAKATAPKGERT